MSLLKLTGALLALALLGGCAAPKTIDYTAYKQARPKSILVLPPINESPEVQASYSMVSQVTYPLAEAGYYVLPIALVDETFRQNGLRTGTTLWTGSARASSEEGNNNSGGSLVGMLITAAVKQVINSSTDAAHPIAGITSARLLSAGQRTGLLYGPRNPKYGTD